MPRVSPSLIRRALKISPHAASLLPVCRDIPSALTELRWIHEHIQSTPSVVPPRLRLPWLCRKRGEGVPLQYVLGTQPFGHLDIKCRPGVLIPRPEPEAYTMHLAHLIKTGHFTSLLGDSSRTQGLRVVDFCSGTGCIALLLYALLQSAFPILDVHGIDISRKAIDLSRENIRHNISRGFMPSPSSPAQSIRFSLGDIFRPDWQERLFSAPSSHREATQCDILISNPPYISVSGFARDTARSVRNYEPKLAQVPIPRDREADVLEEDVFYSSLLQIGEVLRPKVMLFEVGGAAQARRVVSMAQRRGYLNGWTAEIWRDWPDGAPEDDECRSAVVNGTEVAVKGSGHERSVLIYNNGTA